MFTGQARRQAEEILEYVSAIGSAALVDVRAGVVELMIGSPDGAPSIDAARSPHRGDLPVIMLDDRVVVGAVGSAHALVVRLFDPLPARPAAMARVSRACLLLNQMIHPARRSKPPGIS